GIETENLTEDQLRYLVTRRDPTLRTIAAKKLIESGMSQRQAAKALGVDQKTISNDLRKNSSKSEKVRTGSAKTKERRAKVVEAATAKGVTEAPVEQVKYRIVYADPPWDYGAHLQPDYQTEQRDHYPVMPLEAICAEQVDEWTEDNAVLFLWVTSPILEKAFSVIKAWGFEYKSSFVWDKINH